jgi:hypothetical protein
VYHEERDIVEAWCLDGCVRRTPRLRYLTNYYRNDFLTPEDLEDLDIVRDSFLGPARDMTSQAPFPDPDDPGKLRGGTAFERCGQRAVKESGRCYSLTMTHQRQRALVGPTSSGKSYDNIEDMKEYSLNLELRRKVTQVGVTIAIFNFMLTFIFSR